MNWLLNPLALSKTTTKKLWHFLVKCRSKFLPGETKTRPAAATPTEITNGPITTTEVITTIAQTPIHFRVIVTIVEREATWQETVGPNPTIIATTIAPIIVVIGIGETTIPTTTPTTIPTTTTTKIIIEIPATTTDLSTLMILNWLILLKPL